MSSLFNNVMTLAGLDLLIRAQAGAGIKYTRIVLGDGYVPDGQALTSMTTAAHEVVSLNNLTLSCSGGKAVVRAHLAVDDVPQDFYYRELCLYAQDPDTQEEILYSYGNAGDTAEIIRPADGANIVERNIDIITTVGNATNITVTIDSTLTASIQYVNDVRAELEAKLDAIDVASINEALAAIATKVDKADVGAVADLTTTNKANLVAAINELDQELAALARTHAADKSDLVNAIAEVRAIATAVPSAYTVTLAASSWSDTVPYVQYVEVAGMTDCKPLVQLVLSDDYETALLENEEKVKIDSIKTQNGSIYAKCLTDKPSVDLTLSIQMLKQ